MQQFEAMFLFWPPLKQFCSVQPLLWHHEFWSLSSVGPTSLGQVFNGIIHCLNVCCQWEAAWYCMMLRANTIWIRKHKTPQNGRTGNRCQQSRNETRMLFVVVQKKKCRSKACSYLKASATKLSLCDFEVCCGMMRSDFWGVLWANMAVSTTRRALWYRHFSCSRPFKNGRESSFHRSQGSNFCGTLTQISLQSESRGQGPFPGPKKPMTSTVKMAMQVG